MIIITYTLAIAFIIKIIEAHLVHFFQIWIPLNIKQKSYKSWEFYIILWNCYFYVNIFSALLLFLCILARSIFSNLCITWLYHSWVNFFKFLIVLYQLFLIIYSLIYFYMWVLSLHHFHSFSFWPRLPEPSILSKFKASSYTCMHLYAYIHIYVFFNIASWVFIAF